MRTLIRLLLVAAVSCLGAVVLALHARTAAATLAAAPPSGWGPAQLSGATVVIVCGLGATACLWHLASVGLALVVVAGRIAPAGTGRPPGPRPSSRVAHELLRRFGAPLVRRITVGAVVAGMFASPAMAAENPVPDDLGWRTTASAAPADGDAEPGTDPPADADSATPKDPAQSPETSPDVTDPFPDDPLAPATPDASGPDGGPTRATTTHVVAPGDSLWSITAEALGPGASPDRVARAWPVVYEDNAGTIGGDPSLLRPGTTLHLPTPTPEP